MSRPFAVRRAVPADRAEQARLFNLCFGKDKGPDTFAWKYERNPDGAAISLLACDEDGRVVGGYSYMPRRFLRDGRPVVLWQASDAMTEPAWRGRGIFTGLDDEAAACAGQMGSDWAFAYSGRQSLKGFLRNGWVQLGHAPLYRLLLRSRRALGRLGRAGRLATLAAPLGDLLLAGRRERLAAGAATLAPLPRFDASVDALFEAAAPRVGLVGVRDARWLNWRYVDTPSRRQECWALRRDGALAGYLVTEIRDGLAHLVDHCAADEAARAALLAGFCGLAAARGCDEATALLFAHHPAVPHLRALGYRPPRGTKPFRDIFPYIVRACRADAPAADRALSRWHLADGDRDAEHVSG